MYYRELGSTGARVSEIGMGCNRLGEPDQPDEHWIRLVQRAAELGVNVFDTAEAYGWGRSEEMIGRALGNRDDVLIATKMCRVRETDARDFTAARMVSTVEGSLERLRRDRIDIYQLHSPNREELERLDWAEGMARLQQQGKIRFRGVAVNNVAHALWLIRQGLVEVLQITYNIFAADAEDALLDVARERGVGLLCRMPLARGVLTGKFQPGVEIPAGHRARLDGEGAAERVEMAEDLRPLGGAYEGGMTRLALHYGLTSPAVSALIPGARTLAQLEENVAASNGRGLPPEVYAQVVQIRAGWSS
jgi:aryl-alcohol dehydrogenase-like predicted oxidoreductase